MWRLLREQWLSEQHNKSKGGGKGAGEDEPQHNPHKERKENSAFSVKRLPKAYVDGLLSCRLEGRCQCLPVSDRLCFYLDGAHTTASMKACVEWFSSCLHPPPSSTGNCGLSKPLDLSPSSQRRLLLIFNCAHNRNPFPLLDSLVEVLRDLLSHLFPHRSYVLCIATLVSLPAVCWVFLYHLLPV